MDINYSGLYRAQRRDNKSRKRRRLNMTEDGRSVKLLNHIIQKKSKKSKNDLERLSADMPDLRSARDSG